MTEEASFLLRANVLQVPVAVWEYSTLARHRDSLGLTSDDENVCHSGNPK